MREAVYNNRDEHSTVRGPPRKQEYVLPPPKPDHSARLQTRPNPSRSMSWSDPDELSQLLDFFTTPSLRTTELPRQSTYDNSYLPGGDSGRLERATFKARASQSPGTPPSSFKIESAIVNSPRKVPLKAQRLMGLDTTVTYNRSTFDDWEDEERINGSPRRRSLVRRSKQDSKGLPLPSRDSKWSTLSQRFRSNSTTPINQRLRNSNSSPKDSFDDFLAKDNTTIKLKSPDRINSLIHAPVRPNFLVDQRKIMSESKIKGVAERSEWAEARASSRALNSSMDPMRAAKASQAMRKNSSDSAKSDVPVQIIRATPPLRFNPNRRPRAPFPTDQFESSSGDEGKGPDKLLPLVASPLLARCPSKMQMPSRVMRPGPATPAKEEVIPIRPRRPTESNIFADKDVRSPVKSLPSPTRRLTTPPRQPPPSIPIPPLPSMTLKYAKAKQQGGKTDGLKTALGVQASSPLFSSEDQELLQTSPETSPQAVVFCGEKVAQTFAVTLKHVEKEVTPSEDLVELIVGGVQFEAPLSTLSNADLKATGSGLAASIEKHLKKQVQDSVLHKSSNVTLSVPINSRRSKNTVNSYDDGTSPTLESPSSSEDESEEEIVPVFGYETMTWTHHIEAVEGGDILTPIKTFQMASPLRSLAHARTPTSVSMDCDESIEGDEEENESSSSDPIHHRRHSATPELIGPHTFIFTASSPPSSTQLLPLESTVEPAIGKLQVTLHRDPQPYPFILHFLKTGSLPSFFSEKRFSILERQRALQQLCLESRWLGYTGLAEKCNEALDAMSTQKMFSVLQ